MVFANLFRVAAQHTDSTIKFMWKDEVSNISAAVEIYGLQKAKIAAPIYFLDKVDTVFNSSKDSLFHDFFNTSVSHCPLVKISFYYFNDTIGGKKVKVFSDVFTKSILPDIHKKVPQLSTNNFIISGINDLCLVVLFCASTNPVKINKTALFMNDDINLSSITTLYLEVLSRLKGKIFLYANHKDSIDVFTESFAKTVALTSTAVIYKFDRYENPVPINLFTEVYKWLLADGNNYVLEN